VTGFGLLVGGLTEHDGGIAVKKGSRHGHWLSHFTPQTSDFSAASPSLSFQVSSLSPSSLGSRRSHWLSHFTPQTSHLSAATSAPTGIIRQKHLTP